jgi:hypothetical protein
VSDGDNSKVVIKRTRLGEAVTTGIGVLVAALTLATSAQAASYVVDSTDNESDADPANAVCATAGGSCTLRAAIEQSNGSGSPGADTITFSVTGAIDLPTGLPPIVQQLDVQGPGASQLTVRRTVGAPPFPVFSANPPAGTPVTIAGLTITNGQGRAPNGGGGVSGGQALLTLRDAIVTANRASGDSFGGIAAIGGVGGGIAGVGGSLTVIDSAITDNQAAGVDGGYHTITGEPLPGSSGEGGGIYASGSLRLVRSTISGNSVTGGDGADGTLADPDGADGGDALGAGVYVRGFPSGNPTSVGIENTTISGNVAGPAGAGGGTAAINGAIGAPGLARGGGISLDGLSSNTYIDMTITNSTIAGNTAPSGANLGLRRGPAQLIVTIRGTLLADPIDGANCETDNAPIASAGFNLEDANPSTCLLTRLSDITGPDPGLLPLADNGGVGQTHAFSKTSSVVDTGKAFSLGVDQRGLTRPFGFGDIADAAGGDGSDIGAFELHAPACEDGNDNDGDGTIDLADPGCTDSADGDEADPPAADEADPPAADEADPPTPEPTPELTLELTAKKTQETERLRATASCSIACTLEVRAKGKAGKRFSSKLASAELAANVPTPIELKIKPKLLAKIEDERGRAKLTASATATASQSAADAAKVKLKP